IVDEVLVQEGQTVDMGTPLVALADDQIKSELTQIRSRRAHQSLHRTRLLALVEDAPLETGDQFSAFEDLIEEQSALYRAERATVTAEANATQSEIQELISEQQAVRAETASLRAQLGHATEEVEMLSGLLDRGLSTRSRVLSLKRQLAQIRADLAASERSELSALRAISDAKRRLATRTSELHQSWSREIAELSASIIELEQAEEQLMARLGRLTIRSPSMGTVHEIVIDGSGDVLAPGDHVITVVPATENLIAEVRLDPKDVGFVEIGSTAEVTVTSFDREIFGTVIAETLSISPTTFQIRDEDPHYLVRLSVDRQMLEGARMTGALLSGMVVRAEFRTGEKSILRYMLKPIVRAWDVAFSER
ncbi:MAG: HlyD family type I secretion periplasmic adaptor subunit, partial [Pseudomonadota bacterium]